MERVKVITSHSGHARFNEECEFDKGFIPRQDIPSPYAYSPVHDVFKWREMACILVETRHRRFEVFKVPVDARVYAREADAMAIYLNKEA